MATKSFISYTPESGTGDATINVGTLTDNTGRNARTTSLVVSAVGFADQSVQVRQKGKPEFVSFDNSVVQISSAGGLVTVTGKSNSKKLTFSTPSDGTLFVLPAGYTANSESLLNGAELTGDPGQSAEYEFSIKFEIAKTESLVEQTQQLVVTDDYGHQRTCTIKQTASAAFINVSPVTIEFEWNDTSSKYITIDSNTNWNIS